MVKISNMGKATGVVPELQYVLDRLAVKKPLFTYEAYDTRETVNDDGNGTKIWVRAVTVFQDAEEVGVIDHRLNAGRVDSMGVQPDAFLVESVHIKRERGRRNTVITSDANVALKTAIKYFAPMSPHDICEKAMRNVNDMMDTVLYRARNCLQDIVSYNGGDVMQYLVERHLKGTEIPLPKSIVIREDKLFLYDKFLAGSQIREAYIGDRLNRKGYALWELPDTSIRVLPVNYKVGKAYDANVADGMELKRYRSFDELPEAMKDKVAVLKIAEKGEPIMDIGVKLDDKQNVMYILE